MKPFELGIPDAELRALGVFNRNGVKYLIIGGTAVRFYGSQRDISDIDLFVGNSLEQAAVLYAAIEEIMGKPPGFGPQDLEEPRMKVSLRRTGYEIDILTSIDRLDFNTAYADRNTAAIGGIVVSVVSKPHLLFIKRVASKNEKRRVKEMEDIRFLESV